MAKRKRKPRGAKGDGYTTFDKSRGKYRAVYRGRSKYFPDALQAKEWRKAQKALDAALAQPASPADQMLTKALTDYIAIKRNIAHNTRRVAKSFARRIVAILGDRPMGSITERDIARMDEINRQELGSNSCEHLLVFLRGLFNRFTVLGYLVYNPVAQYYTLTPKRARGGKPAREPEVLSVAQIHALLDALDGYEYQPMFLWLCVLPLRISELRGLRWQNVDTLRNTVHIVEQFTGRTPDFSPPKSKDGIRLLPAPARLFALTPRVDSHLGLVFPNLNGNPRNDQTIRTYFDKALARAELPYLHVHDLRHTAASGLLNIGCPPHIVAAFLGHAPDGITMHYARPELETLRPWIETWGITVLDRNTAKVVRIGA